MHRFLLSMFSLALVLITTPAVSQVVQEAPNTPASEVRFTLAPADEFAGFSCTVFLVDEDDRLRRPYASAECALTTAERAAEVRSLAVDDATATGRTVRLIGSVMGVRSFDTIRSRPFVLGDDPLAVHPVRMPPLGALVLHLPDLEGFAGASGELRSVITVPSKLSVPLGVRIRPAFDGLMPDPDLWDHRPINTWEELRRGFPDIGTPGFWVCRGSREGDAGRVIVSYLPVGEYWAWCATEDGLSLPRKFAVGEHRLAEFTPGDVRSPREVIPRPASGVDVPDQGMLGGAWYRSRVGGLLQAGMGFGVGKALSGRAEVPVWAEGIFLAHVSFASRGSSRTVVDFTSHDLPDPREGDTVDLEITPDRSRGAASLPNLPVDAEAWHMMRIEALNGPAAEQFPRPGVELLIPSAGACIIRGLPRGKYDIVRSVPQGDWRSPDAPPDKVFRDQLVIE